MMIEKNLLFDFDGTLADTLSLNHQIMNELSKKYKFKHLSAADVKYLKNLPATQVLKHMGIAPYKVPFVMAAGKRKMNQRIDEIGMFCGLKSLLEKWALSHQMGVVTTNSTGNVKQFLHNHQVSSMDFIYADIRLMGKARVLKRAIKKHRLDKLRTLYIGDEIRDIKAARAAGIAVVALCWGYNSKDSLLEHKPDYLVENLTELEQAVEAFFNLDSA